MTFDTTSFLILGLTAGAVLGFMLNDFFKDKKNVEKPRADN